MLVAALKLPASREPFSRAELRQHIEARIAPDLVGGCWLWTAALSRAGYGVMCFGARWPQRTVRAHRIAYIAWHGDIPDGLVIDHKCRVRACVNPAHLRAVTPAQNSLENSNSLTAIGAAKTHCLRGHPMPAPNKRGYRICQDCARIHQERSTARRRSRAIAAKGLQ